MKTAISIEDGLLREADDVARLMGVSRSRLFALAVGTFLREHRREQMLRRLNEVYGNVTTPDEKRLLRAMKGKVRQNVKENW